MRKRLVDLATMKRSANLRAFQKQRGTPVPKLMPPRQRPSRQYQFEVLDEVFSAHARDFYLQTGSIRYPLEIISKDKAIEFALKPNLTEDSKRLLLQVQWFNTEFAPRTLSLLTELQFTAEKVRVKDENWLDGVNPAKSSQIVFQALEKVESSIKESWVVTPKTVLNSYFEILEKNKKSNPKIDKQQLVELFGIGRSFVRDVLAPVLESDLLEGLMRTDPRVQKKYQDLGEQLTAFIENPWATSFADSNNTIRVLDHKFIAKIHSLYRIRVGKYVSQMHIATQYKMFHDRGEREPHVFESVVAYVQAEMGPHPTARSELGKLVSHVRSNDSNSPTAPEVEALYRTFEIEMDRLGYSPVATKDALRILADIRNGKFDAQIAEAHAF